MGEQKTLIAGLGLIGGSLASALRKNDPECILLGADSNAASVAAALESGVINQGGELEELLPQADLLVLALPPLAISGIVNLVASKVSPTCVITDVGSVKSHIIEAVNSLGADFSARFVPGHPIAGSEQSGFPAAKSDLFAQRKVILTPQRHTAPAAIARVNAMWRKAGAEILGMSPGRHDRVLAATSHLPHLLAYAIVDMLLHTEDSDDIFRYAAGGFADFSRVASSNARMWSDIFAANSEATVAVLDDYIANLESLKRRIQNRDLEGMMAIFERAKQTRDNFIKKHYNTGKDSMDSPSREVVFKVEPGGSVAGKLRVPGDKSISHRSVIFGSLADGITEVTGFLEGEDALNTVAAFREMGVTIIGPEQGSLTIYGVGKHGLQAPRKPLYMGNSGTAMRLMAGLLAAQDFESELSGDESLSGRPMGRVADPLREMGATIETAAGGTPPLRIRGSKLKAIDYTMPVASAQVKSCLLLAGLYAEGLTRITEPAVCRDHTERMLTGFGVEVGGGYPDPTVTLREGQRLTATSIEVPADISSAAFFLVAASIAPGSDLTLEHVGINPTRIGIITILQQMGANLSLHNERVVGGEPVADIRVQHANLRGIEIDRALVPLAIDEFPVLFVAAACAQGETLLRGAEELRVKESDRLDAMAQGLQSLGVELETYPDGIRIQGGTLGGGVIDSHGDHRIAMAFAVAALRARDAITIRNCQNVATSFPGFAEVARDAGLALSETLE